MADIEALNRISQLQIRIIQDRPKEQIKGKLWDMVKKEEQGGKYNEIQKTRTVANDATNRPKRNRHTMTRAKKQRQREQSESYRRRQQQGQKEIRLKIPTQEICQYGDNTYRMTPGAGLIPGK